MGTKLMIKQEEKQFYMGHVLDIINNKTKPIRYTYETEQGTQPYYLLGNVPFGKLVIYEETEIHIIEGINQHGVPQHTGITYSAQSIQAFFGRDINISEREVVLKTRELIKHYKPNKTNKTSKGVSQ